LSREKVRKSKIFKNNELKPDPLFVNTPPSESVDGFLVVSDRHVGTSYILFVKRKSKSLKNIFQNNFLEKGPLIQQHLSIKSSQDFTLVRRISRQ